MSMIPALMGGRKLSHSIDFDSASAASALLRLGVHTIDMANAQVKLVTNQTSTSGELQLSGQLLIVDPNGGAQDLLLPAEADSKGLFLIIYNTGGEALTIKEDSDTNDVAVLDAAGNDSAQWALLWCNGEATAATASDPAIGAGHVGWTAQVFTHAIT